MTAVGAAGSPRRAAVLGHPIGHSLSPVLHRAAYRALGLDGWTYEAIDATVDDLPGLLAALDDSWAGLSVTMPLKIAVQRHLAHVEPLAEAVGVVNTVLVQPGPRIGLVGANTDVHGIVAALREVGVGSLAGRRAVVLGGGATAASALAALGELGAVEPVVLVRSLARAGGTVRAAHRMGLQPRFQATSGPAAAVDAWRGADVVVSTLPPGAGDAAAVALAATGGGPVTGTLLDCAYDPRPTPLAAAWEAAGGRVAPGERMLLHQAAEQVRLMTGRPAPLAAMDAALQDVFTQRDAGSEHLP